MLKVMILIGQMKALCFESLVFLSGFPRPDSTVTTGSGIMFSWGEYLTIDDFVTLSQEQASWLAHMLQELAEKFQSC
jgi:hypothetical protein